jgi:1,4-alpha-glucan branching enzyme
MLVKYLIYLVLLIFFILVQLMPVNQFSGLHSWGYDIRYNFAVRFSFVKMRIKFILLDRIFIWYNISI